MKLHERMEALATQAEEEAKAFRLVLARMTADATTKAKGALGGKLAAAIGMRHGKNGGNGNGDETSQTSRRGGARSRTGPLGWQRMHNFLKTQPKKQAKVREIAEAVGLTPDGVYSTIYAHGDVFSKARLGVITLKKIVDTEAVVKRRRSHRRLTQAEKNAISKRMKAMHAQKRQEARHRDSR